VRIAVAGATGALAGALIPKLVAAGHDVTGLSRSPAAAERIGRLGAQLGVANLLDPDGLREALGTAKPDVVVHAAKAIPKRGPMTFRDMRATNRLHDEGTRNLVAAALSAGASRFIAESIVFAYGYGDFGADVLTEDRAPRADLPRRELLAEVDGVLAMERHTRDACSDLDGIILRFGLFYGPNAGTELMASLLRRRLLPLPGGGTGVWPVIYVEDAADAIVCALTNGQPGEAYNIVDDEPVRLRDLVAEVAAAAGTPGPWSVPKSVARLGAGYFAEVASTTMRVSNAKAKRELGWTPAHPTYRDGLAAWSAERVA
jgi:nucleoside-diphosphate-sugar epimerase